MSRLALLALVAAACGGSSAPAPAPVAPTPADPAPIAAAPPVAPPARPNHAERIARIEAGLLPAVQIRGRERTFTLANRMRELKIHAVAIAVFDRYELQWTKAWGFADAEAKLPATEQTTFLAGSISKSVNALAAMRAVAAKQLSLDAPINDALTSWKLPDNDLTRKTPVTLRQLLSHTAGTTQHGFPGYVAGTPLPTVPQILDGVPPANTGAVRVDLAPGTKFRYSGGGTTIVQLALTERTKQAYPALLHASVLAPLGMVHSTFEQVPPPATAAVGYRADGTPIPGKRNAYPEMGAAGLWTTPEDLARFFLELAKARAGTSKLIPRELAVQMTTPVTEIVPGNSIGLGVFLSARNGAAMFGHGGSDEGFQADATASLDGGYGVVVMASSDSGVMIFDEIERAVFAEYAWPGADPVYEPATADPARFVGTYVVDGMGFTVTASAEGGLEMRLPFDEPSSLVAIDTDTLISVQDGAKLHLDGKQLALSTRRRPAQVVARLDATNRVPLIELEAGRFDAAVAAWRALRKADPKHRAVDEDQMNYFGYSLIQRGKPAQAVLVMRLIVAGFPESSNAHDSLGEAYAAAGETAKAIASYELSIRKIDGDKRLGTAGLKAARRKHAEEALAKLRAKKK